jgi:hypothetical protein
LPAPLLGEPKEKSPLIEEMPDRAEEFRANIVRPYDVFPQNGSMQGRMPHVENRFTFSLCTAFHRKFSRFSTWIFGEINKFSTIRG